MPSPHRKYRLYSVHRPLALLAVFLTVVTFAVAEPTSAAPSVASARPQVAGLATVSETISEASMRAAAATVDSVDSVPGGNAVGFRALATMPARAQHLAPAPPAAPSAPVQSAVQRAASSGSSPAGYGCAAALAYLRANAAPGFTFACPGYAYGNQAMTCVNHAPQCAGQKIIAIAVPCAAAYMNEAHNSWVLTGHGTGIDPYGYCH